MMFIYYVYNLKIKPKKLLGHIAVEVWYFIFTYLHKGSKGTISLKTVSGQMSLIWCEGQPKNIQNKVTSETAEEFYSYKLRSMPCVL